MVEAVQLRAPTILFIDDNPLNLAEATHFVPGLQVADETCIPALLDNPLLQGKNDEQLSRLAQYRLLETRKQDETASGDTTAFLRESGITVTIDHDIEAHLDRAIELINRTNQLNFTKKRLPEDIEEARAALREELSGYRVQAGILRVRDRYGDYGHCGLYLMMSGWNGRLVYFCFSCRILGMGIETWLYQRLDRPRLRVMGDVLTDLTQEREIDWITVVQAHLPETAASAPRMLQYVYARGGCDLRPVAHYLAVSADEVIGEWNAPRNGTNVLWQHSVFARHAVEGFPEAALPAARLLGYQADDFASFLSQPPRVGQATVWVLSFWADLRAVLFRHKETGLVLPPAVGGIRKPGEPAKDGADVTDPARAALQARIDEEFEFVGRISPEDFRHNVRLVLGRAPAEAHVFILLMDECDRRIAEVERVNQGRRHFNELTIEAAAGFDSVTFLRMSDMVLARSEEKDGHFDRKVYYRIFERIMQELGQRAEPVAEPDAAELKPQLERVEDLEEPEAPAGGIIERASRRFTGLFTGSRKGVMF